MPYKDKNKQREAYRKWSINNKEKRRAYQVILRIAKKHNPIPQTCIIDGCEEIGERHHPDYSKPHEVVWICRYHHRRTEHSTKCSICGDKALGRGFCNKHYKQERKKTDPEYANRVRELRKKYRKDYKP